MKKEEYRDWLEHLGYTINTIKLQMARAKKVEKWAGDLDSLFEQDQLDSLLSSLTVARTDDPNAPMRLNHSIPINSANPGNMTASYRAAINLYRKFRLAPQAETDENIFRPRIIRRSKKKSSLAVKAKVAQAKKRDQLAKIRPHKSPELAAVQPIQSASSSPGKPQWPAWPKPQGREILEIVGCLTPYVRFLAPEIVAGLVQDNEQRRQQWTQLMTDRQIEADRYLWPKSSCAFPGVRGRVGLEEPNDYFPAAAGSQALMIDDNSYPKLLWSYLVRGDSSGNLGPEGYVLTWLLDFQSDPEQWSNPFGQVAGQTLPAGLHGLFTCASNLVYLPWSFRRILDADPRIRLLLLHKAQQLYWGICNPLPPAMALPPLDKDWGLYRFSWSAGEGRLEYLRLFLDYRLEHLPGLGG